LLYLIELCRALRSGAPAGDDPWDARTLEWHTTSPPPVYNFERLPVVASLDAFWEAKQGADVLSDLPAHESGIRLPQPSYFPALCTLGILLGAYGLLYSGSLAIAGLVLAVFSIYGWAFEGVGQEEWV
jgi:cytochrome c oxidase subunit 1